MSNRPILVPTGGRLVDPTEGFIKSLGNFSSSLSNIATGVS